MTCVAKYFTEGLKLKKFATQLGIAGGKQPEAAGKGATCWLAWAEPRTVYLIIASNSAKWRDIPQPEGPRTPRTWWFSVISEKFG